MIFLALMYGALLQETAVAPMPIFQRDSLLVFLIFILPLFLRVIIAAYHEIMATKPSNHHLNGMFLLPA